jgi:hypothetical protein
MKNFLPAEMFQVSVVYMLVLPFFANSTVRK